MEDRTEVDSVDGVERSLELYESDDGRIVVYDEHNPDAYVRSDTAVPVER